MDLSTRMAEPDAACHVEEPDLAAPPLGDRPQPLPLLVERVTARAMIEHQPAWQDLCERALERNVFLEPAFHLPIVQHGFRERPDFMLVWEDNGPTSFGRLVGLLPIRPPTAWCPGIVRGLTHDQIRLGVPLIDRERGAEALDALLDGLRDLDPGAAALRLTELDGEGPFATLLTRRCTARSRRCQRFGAHRRAVLVPAAEPCGNVTSFARGKRRKELGRQRRRLSEKGVRTYTSAIAPDEVARATERFLALEEHGWKGERGTALLATPALATFTRTMTRMMAHEGKCRIDAIEIDGVPVAMGIVLTVDARAHFWKTAFHESFASLSPGVQFALELTERQLGDRAVTLTDSCAVPDHPMIDRLWSGRMEVTDLLVELDPQAPRRFHAACRREHLVRTLRAKVKLVYGRIRKRLGAR